MNSRGIGVLLLAIATVMAAACATAVPVRSVGTIDGSTEYQVSCRDAALCNSAIGDTCPKGYMIEGYTDGPVGTVPPTPQPLNLKFICATH
jgi:hypothetical protein